MELRDYIRVLRRSWLIIVITTLLGLLAAGAYSMLQTPVYQSTAKVFVSTSGGSTAAELQQGNALAQQSARTSVDLVSTPQVLDPVIEELGLDMSAGGVAGMLSTSVPANSSTIQITASTSDPDRSAQIASAVARSLAVAIDANTPAPPEPTEDNPSPARIVLEATEALPPTDPISPNTRFNLVIGVLLGFVIGLALAALRHALDTRIRNEADVESITDARIVGGIMLDRGAKRRPLVVQAEPRSPHAEAFRALRSAVHVLDSGDATSAFVLTSSVEHEGASTTAANLAIAFAEAGARVLLVDADLRKPHVATLMGVPGSTGLSDVLEGRVPLMDAVQQWGERGLSVLPAGTLPPNPSELLGSPAMVDAVALMRESFDLVLFVAPPILPVTDAAVLGRLVSGVLLVAAAGRVKRAQLSGALQTLEHTVGPVAGIVMTMLPTRGADVDGRRRFGYGYQYGASRSSTAGTASTAGARR